MTNSIWQKLKGKFIVFEGIEGAGKSTQVNRLAQFLQNKNIDLILTREPGGTPIGENIRQIFLHRYNNMCTKTELLLLFAARVQHIETVIKPALKAKKCVLCDRFVDASYAYQGGGRKIPPGKIDSLVDCMLENWYPDWTLLLDIDVQLGQNRVNQRGEKDRIEQENEKFFNRVRQAYLAQVKRNHANYIVLDASQTEDNVFNQTVVQLKSVLETCHN